MSQAIHKGIWATGREYGKAETIIQFLSHRFNTVPKSVEKKVYTIRDADQLNELAGCAAKCESLDEFAKALKPQKK